MATPDVLVVGGGNAALVAALSAREKGASVLLVERSPRALRGGNTRHTRDIRYLHEVDRYTTGPYPMDEFWADLSRVAGTLPFDEALARVVIERSSGLPGWMERHGVRWQEPLRGALHLSRTNAFFRGGGKALLNAYYEHAVQAGVAIAYETTVEAVHLDGSRFRAVSTRDSTGVHEMSAPALIVAAGGFEANLEWIGRYWDGAAHNFIIRGSPYNDGRVLASLLEQGARSVGDPRGFHAIAVDARAPKYDGGIVTRIDSIPFGIVVNAAAHRFADEGEDLWPKRYASWGGLLATQPGQIAYSIFDARADGKFIPSMFPPVTAASIRDLALQLELDPEALAETVDGFNASVQGDGRLDMSHLDNNHTEGLPVPKSHWAVRLDLPPYRAYAVRPGITFTYMGVAVGEDFRIRRNDGDVLSNVFGAGEMISGNVLSSGYLAGFGLTIGAVSGHIAGEEAARCVKR